MTGHSTPFHPDGRVNRVFYNEVAHPYQALTTVDFEVDLASFTGYFVTDVYSLSEEFLSDDETKILKNPNHPYSVLLKRGIHKASELNASDYGMFFASVGFASVYEYPTACALQTIAKHVWTRTDLVATVCHGGALSPGIRDDKCSGGSIIAGLQVTGFSTEGDRLAGVLPKMREDGVKTIEESAVAAGAEYMAPPEPFSPFSVSSGRFVIGANLASARTTATASVEAFEKLWVRISSATTFGRCPS